MMCLNSMFKKMGVFAIALGILLVLCAQPVHAGGGDAPFFLAKDEAVSGSVPQESPLLSGKDYAVISGPKFAYGGKTYTWSVTTSSPLYSLKIWYWGTTPGFYPNFMGSGDRVSFTMPSHSNLYLQVVASCPGAEEFVGDTHVVYRTVASSPGTHPIE